MEDTGPVFAIWLAEQVATTTASRIVGGWQPLTPSGITQLLILALPVLPTDFSNVDTLSLCLHQEWWKPLKEGGGIGAQTMAPPPTLPLPQRPRSCASPSPTRPRLHMASSLTFKSGGHVPLPPSPTFWHPSLHSKYYNGTTYYRCGRGALSL